MKDVAGHKGRQRKANGDDDVGSIRTKRDDLLNSEGSELQLTSHKKTSAPRVSVSLNLPVTVKASRSLDRSDSVRDVSDQNHDAHT
jgi:hypothetical protein